MKTSILSIPLAASILLTACATAETASAPETAPAGQETAAAPPAPGASGGHAKRTFLETYDTDGDGQVTLAEFAVEREKGFQIRDADGDSAVHEEEYVSEYEARLEQDLKAQRERQIKQAYVRFDVLDTDDDDVISLAEFSASGSNMFTDLDTNGDGIVNAGDTAEAY